MKQNSRWGFGICLGFSGTRSQHNTNGLLNALENAGIDFRLVPFGRAIDDPDVIARSTQVVAHLLKSRPVQEASHSNKTNNSGLVSRVMVVNFPRRPTP